MRKSCCLALALFMAAVPSLARAEFIWGVNGHPFTAYPNLTLQQQIDELKALGGTSYRVNVSSLDYMDGLKALVAMGKSKGITILPILIPPLEPEKESEENLYSKSKAFARYYATAFPEIEVWELGNELDNFAILQPCEMRDDGSQYPCEWGPAGGVGADEYFTPRYKKVAAILRGLSEGTAEAAPDARRAIGTAGWGHVGFFERLAKDKITWDITIWHMYEFKDEWAFKELQKYGKPIWITEFNHSQGSAKDGEEAQAAGLKQMMEGIYALRTQYNIEAAHIYELFDEPQWAPNFEAFMGLISVVKSPEGTWMVGPPKKAYAPAREIMTTMR